MKRSCVKDSKKRKPFIAEPLSEVFPEKHEIPTRGTQYKLGDEIRTVVKYLEKHNRIGYSSNKSAHGYATYTNWHFWLLWVNSGAKIVMT
jgi:hypothetical protein